jgi:hypothetical protein
MGIALYGWEQISASTEKSFKQVDTHESTHTTIKESVLMTCPWLSACALLAMATQIFRPGLTLAYLYFFHNK